MPRTLTKATNFTPALSRMILSGFSVQDSTSIMKSCRKHGLTFGNMYPILGQIALARVLCRRRIRGEIDSSEWDFRRKEPMLTAGPLNLRNYLDKTWYNNGGNEIVAVMIGFFFFNLPFLPLGSASFLAPGDRMPEFQDLLSLKRFVYRSLLIRKQAERDLRNPLFIEIGAAYKPARIQRIRSVAEEWQRSKSRPSSEFVPISPIEQIKLGPVMAHGGSSFGNVSISVVFIPSE